VLLAKKRIAATRVFFLATRFGHVGIEPAKKERKWVGIFSGL
jgi:hypothetical protein